MDSVYHERQEGQLCAQHCLNNLLQGPYFTAVELATFARELDEDEKDRMAEGGHENPAFLRFMQVIAKALAVWELEMVPLTSPLMKHAMENPTSQQAFICNHDYHWLTVRKLGQQWFNMNSLLKRPELISDTYLSLFLHQLKMEGYSIFVVTGMLPACEANDVLTLVRAEPVPTSPPPQLHSHSTEAPTSSQAYFQDSPYSLGAHSGTKRGCKIEETQLPPKYHRSGSGEYCYGDEVDKDDDHALQIAMALSASLQQNPDQLSDDQQLPLQLMSERDPLVSSSQGGYGGDALGYGLEEEEAALTAALYASLEDREQTEKASIPLREEEGTSLSGLQQHVEEEQERKKEEEEKEEEEEKLKEEEEKEEEEEEEEDEKTKVMEEQKKMVATGSEAEEGMAGGSEGSKESRKSSSESRADSSYPMSQEELRIRRLMHLEQSRNN